MKVNLDIEMIGEFKARSEGKDMYSFLYYETYNNLARIENDGSNIEASLQYLLLALEHTRYFTALGNKEKAEQLI